MYSCTGCSQKYICGALVYDYNDLFPSLLLLQVSSALTVQWKLGKEFPRAVPLCRGRGTCPHPQPLPSLVSVSVGPSPPASLSALYVLLIGTDPEETILHAFKVFDTEGKGFVKADV